MLTIFVKVLSVIVIIAFSSGLALANKVGLDNVATRAWTDRDSNSVGLNTQICFRSTFVNNRKQKSNCVRLKSSISGVKQYEHIIFETKNTQFNFKTNNRSGTNIKFWLKERANEDTIGIYSFLNQLNKAEIALVGGMCKKITEMKWLTTTVRRAVDRSNDIDPYVINRFKSPGYQDINRIAKRCQAAVEQKIGKIELVKFAASKTVRKRRDCEYSKNKLYDMQSTLGYLGFYKSKVDGQYGPGTKKAVKISKNYIFQFANRSSDCLSAFELSWLKLLVSVKRKGQECKNFNSYEELKEIAILLERIGRPVFGSFSAIDRVRYSDHDYRKVVYAIIDYENSLDDDYFNVAQKSRDCRIIPLEKVVLVATSENKLSTVKNQKSEKLAKKKDEEEARKKEDELAKRKAKEEARKKDEELAKQKAEEEKRKAEELAKRKAKEEARKKDEELAKQKAEEEKRKAEELAKRKAQEEARKKEKELAKRKAREELLRQKAEAALQKKISSYQEESQLMVLDVKNFMKSPNDFDLVKIAKLVAGFTNTTNTGWNEETVSLYEELKKYVLNFDKFVEFRKGQINLRAQEKNEKIETLIAQIELNTQAIKKYVAENIGSNDLGEAIQLLEAIEEKNNRDLKELNDLFTNIRNFTIIYDIDVDKIPFPLADSDTVENQEPKKSEEPKTKKKVESISPKSSSCFDGYVKQWDKTKEVGDGFSNFEASKDRVLIPFLVQKFNRKKCDHRNIKDDEEIMFSFVLDNNKFFTPNKEASEAFAVQQDITNSFQERETYTVKAKDLALVFEISKRDLKNANCGTFVVKFKDSSLLRRKNDEFRMCQDIKFKE